MTRRSKMTYYQILCECGNHTFEFIDVVTVDFEYGDELEETIRRCAVCKREYECIQDLSSENSRKILYDLERKR